MRGVPLTEEQKSFIKDNLEKLTNKQISEVTGIKIGTIQDFIHRNGIKRSSSRRSYLSKIIPHPSQTNPNSLSNLRLGINTQFGKIDAVTLEKRTKKMLETRKEIIQAERRRLMFGLPQKTNLILLTDQEKKRKALYQKLRRAGYEYLGYSRFRVPSKRHPIMERNAVEKYKVIFIENE